LIIHVAKLPYKMASIEKTNEDQGYKNIGNKGGWEEGVSTKNIHISDVTNSALVE